MILRLRSFGQEQDRLLPLTCSCPCHPSPPPPDSFAASAPGPCDSPCCVPPRPPPSPPPCRPRRTSHPCNRPPRRHPPSRSRGRHRRLELSAPILLPPRRSKRRRAPRTGAQERGQGCPPRYRARGGRRAGICPRRGTAESRGSRRRRRSSAASSPRPPRWPPPSPTGAHRSSS
ncbi:unnamed protein product [Musa banksii]